MSNKLAGDRSQLVGRMAVCIFKRVLKQEKAKKLSLACNETEDFFLRHLRSALFLGGVRAASWTSCKFLTRVTPVYSATFKCSKTFSHLSLSTL